MADEADKPAEASFTDDPATTDLSAKVSDAWAEFTKDLGATLGVLPPGAELDLTLDPTAAGVGEAVYKVSVAGADADTLAGYAVGNNQLPAEHRLARTAVGELVALGWAPPQLTPGADERFGLNLPRTQANRLAAIAVRTLRDVYGTPHPAFLIYELTVPEGSSFTVPTLGVARQLPLGDSVAPRGEVDLSILPLSDAVATVISAMLKTDPDKLPVDSDGDIGIRSGSAMVFVRVKDSPPLVDVFSPVLTEVQPTEKLFVRLAELTHRMPIGRLYCTGDTVWASVPVFGRDFQASHLMLAVQVMTGLADELDDRLHGEFGGKRFFSEAEPPGEKPDDRTGMYL
jgi:hypothetical protein